MCVHASVLLLCLKLAKNGRRKNSMTETMVTCFDTQKNTRRVHVFNFGKWNRHDQLLRRFEKNSRNFICEDGLYLGSAQVGEEWRK